MTDRSPSAATPENDPVLDDLFEALPDPRVQTRRPTEHTPVPGSRRAAREAAAGPTPAGDGIPSSDGHHDEAEATLDALFRHEAEPTAVPRGKKRRGCLVALFVVLLLVAGVAAGGLWAWNTYGDKISEVMGWGPSKDYEAGQATGDALVTIKKGDGGQQVSEALYDAGVTKTSGVFYDMLVKENIANTFYPGVYRMQLKMTAAAALEALNDPKNKMQNSAVIPEGLSVQETVARVSESVDVPLADLQAAVQNPADYGVSASSLEGWLFPALYEFQPGTTAKDVISTLVQRTRDSLNAAGVPAEDEQRVLTIASIIQREARAEADFYKVSRVIQNRLDQGMKLQMDSTAQYGYGELHRGSASTSDAAQTDDNPWNTYVIDGLPATPISNPGDKAIDAAMHPADGPWLYFVTVNMDTGETVFTTSYEEHQKYVVQMQDWCRAHPDSGC